MKCLAFSLLVCSNTDTLPVRVDCGCSQKKCIRSRAQEPDSWSARYTSSATMQATRLFNLDPPSHKGTVTMCTAPALVVHITPRCFPWHLCRSLYSSSESTSWITRRLMPWMRPS
ncbi:uncharacterized protein F5891DRAFT_47146 [Suillus fuscotomentosus]|uniref:Secreted protein n=1 Tax=Suillus fuscotomentosus TaxID=1912939 RepID=A0AAD4HDA1_9AGAM|nr:uncharacterized protein F5891DRAFT_47146 [Suillus fuscotomentosus]KAG1893385.1 hypothetical protein F5891DRAFT_47146 [Suillus fuscotomentosus]